MVWTQRNGVFGTISESNGTVGIKFDLRMSDEDAEMIRSVHELHEEGRSYRKIAAELRISKSRVARLDKRWPDLLRIEEENADDEYDDEDDEWDDDDDLFVGEECEVVDAAVEDRPEVTHPVGPMQAPRACPFMFDGSDEAKRWQRFLFVKFPDKTDREIVEGYAAGDEWCRPPGSEPPRDPADPFGGMEVDVDALGNIRYVEERFSDGKPSVYYAYRPDGKLYLLKSDRMTLANANIFGEFADIGKNGDRKDRFGEFQIGGR